MTEQYRESARHDADAERFDMTKVAIEAITLMLSPFGAPARLSQPRLFTLASRDLVAS